MSSNISETLAGFVAGRVKAERLVSVLTTAYYGRDGHPEATEGLQPLIAIIDRASPGIVELGSETAGPGFGIRLAERPFPKQYESDLKRAAEVYLAERGQGTADESRMVAQRPGGDQGWLARLGRVLHRLFAASG